MQTCPSSEHWKHRRLHDRVPVASKVSVMTGHNRMHQYFSTDRQNPLLFHRSWCRELTRFRALLFLLIVLFLSLAPVLGVSPPGFSPPGRSPPGLSPPGLSPPGLSPPPGRGPPAGGPPGRGPSGRGPPGGGLPGRGSSGGGPRPRPRLAASVDCRGGGDRLDRTN